MTAATDSLARQCSRRPGSARTAFTLEDIRMEKPRVSLVLSAADTTMAPEYDLNVGPPQP